MTVMQFLWVAVFGGGAWWIAENQSPSVAVGVIAMVVAMNGFTSDGRLDKIDKRIEALWDKIREPRIRPDD